MTVREILMPEAGQPGGPEKDSSWPSRFRAVPTPCRQTGSLQKPSHGPALPTTPPRPEGGSGGRFHRKAPLLVGGELAASTSTMALGTTPAKTRFPVRLEHQLPWPPCHGSRAHSFVKGVAWRRCFATLPAPSGPPAWQIPTRMVAAVEVAVQPPLAAAGPVGSWAFAMGTATAI